ncbi:MAG: bifunctional DNA primase/polymerase [Chloroflexota bacterium]|nr:bifunctional DNA primase/polymerase [Chloroflexota bacterium]
MVATNSLSPQHNPTGNAHHNRGFNHDDSRENVEPATGNREPFAEPELNQITPLAAALDAAAQSIQVFPLHAPDLAGRCSCLRDCGRDIGKHPRTRHGLHDASVELAAIRRWWHLWPEANIGVRTGAVSGVFVIDVDPEGYDSLAALASEHGAPGFCPDTWTVRTGRGGAHLYFWHPGPEERIKTSAGLLAPGLDVRGDGGYAILPPSRHANGNRYAWIDGFAPGHVPLAEPPPWLLRLVRTAAASSPRTGTPPFSREAVIEEGQRNGMLTSLAGSMRRRGFSEAAMVAALQIENEERCRPPLSETEIARIARSVVRYAPAPPPSGRRLKVRDVHRA